MKWMAWIPATAIFFACIGGLLAGMALWEKLSPTALRRGFLPMATTRGDRLFIGLLGTAFIHLAWLGLSNMTPWPALGISLVVMVIIGKWG